MLPDKAIKYSGQTLKIIILPAIVGIISGIIALGFRYLLFFFQNLFFQSKVSLKEIPPVEHDLGYLVIGIPVIGGLIVGLITYFFAREVKGHGVPEVMEAVATRGGKLRPRVVLLKALASAISIGSGGAVGREGPIIQIGSGAGSTLGQLLKLPRSTIKILVGCGAAGGIAATFNTPVAGVIFALEIILRELKSQSFISLVISVFFATIISRLFLGSVPAFQIPTYEFQSLYEIISYLVLGIISGLTAFLLIKSVYAFEAGFKRIKIPEYTKPALGGLLVGILGFIHPEVLGYGYATIEEILNEGMLIHLALVLFVMKILAFSLTIGSGASGGIFSPALFIGAALGAAFGGILQQYFPGLTAPAGAYALVGMASVFAGVSRATFTAIIILFELTLDYQIILPLMFACVIADLIASNLSADTIYTKKLTLRGIRISHDMETNVLDIRRVKEIMRYSPGFYKKTKLKNIYKNFLAGNYRTTPVIDDSHKLLGNITLKDLSAIPQENMQDEAEKYINETKVVSYPEETLSEALYKMASADLECIPVLEAPDKPKVIGQVMRLDIIRILKDLERS